jgi:ribosomal protein S18 acetylase RimI-like enzyme
LVATIGNSIIATARLVRGTQPACVTDLQAIEISRFYVAAPLRGSGIAHNLIRACEAEAAARGAPATWLCAWERNARAVAFYTRVGYRSVGATTVMVGNVAFDDHVLLKSLA